MSCILRVSGREWDVDEFVRTTPVTVCAVFHRGQPRHPRVDECCDASGVNIEVSTAGIDDAAGQFDDAIQFLASHRAEIRKLTESAGVETISLDFAFRRSDTAAQSINIPPTLAREAGMLGAEIVVSLYPTDASTPIADSR